MNWKLRCSLLAGVAACLSWTPLHADESVDFTRDVRPILSNYCYQCHGPDDGTREADLRLDQRDAATGELPSGTHAIVAGDPETSELIARVTSDDPYVMMPPEGAMDRPSAQQIEILRRWIAQGAEFQQHWAYVAPTRPALPEVQNLSWPRNEIDYFILHRLDQEGLAPSPPAEVHALLRRTALQVTGLPPTPEEIQSVIESNDPQAFEQYVDELLCKPAYGERWAAHWLDLARYADSTGYTEDRERNIWRWRDWLIHSLNENVPFDQMTIEMLAGDLLPDADTRQIIATGYHRNTSVNTEGGVRPEPFAFGATVDRVNNTLETWMATTIGCAQCHHHKYDPFSQKDYYSLFAIFNATEDFNTEAPQLTVPRVGQQAEFDRLQKDLASAKSQRKERTKQLEQEFDVWASQLDAATLSDELKPILEIAVEERTPEQLKKLKAHQQSSDTRWSELNTSLEQLQKEFDQVSTTTLIMKAIAPRETYIAIRGDYASQGNRVDPGVPEAFPPLPEGVAADRLGLAKWIVAPENPLTARVAVNHLWQQVFGKGLVETSEEFGTQGAPPSHPELLDWLATEYMASGWDTRHMLRLMVTSATYRQASGGSPELLAADPANRLLARGPRFRLSAEALRDQALAVSGLLSQKMYGPPVQPYQPKTGLASAFGPTTDWTTSEGEDAYRRAIYTRWRRNLPYPSMVAFDVPERNVCAARRIRTNTPIQALVTLNDPVFVEAAQALARRIVAEGGADSDERAAFAIRTVLARPAQPAEVERLVALYETSRKRFETEPAAAEALATKPLGPLLGEMPAVDAAAWTVVANVLLNLDETLVPR